MIVCSCAIDTFSYRHTPIHVYTYVYTYTCTHIYTLIHVSTYLQTAPPGLAYVPVLDYGHCAVPQTHLLKWWVVEVMVVEVVGGFEVLSGWRG